MLAEARVDAEPLKVIGKRAAVGLEKPRSVHLNGNAAVHVGKLEDIVWSCTRVKSCRLDL